jgi:hypothetical protein
MKTKVIVVIFILIILAGVAYFLFTPPQTTEYKEEISLQTRSQNTQIYATLLSGGINDSFADVIKERTYVAYELPSGYNSTQTQRFVLGAAADTVLNTSEKIIVVQYINTTPKLAWTVQMSDFKAFVLGELTLDQLEAKIEKKTL